MTFDEWWDKEYAGMSVGYGAEEAWNAAMKEAHQGQSGATTMVSLPITDVRNLEADGSSWTAEIGCDVDNGGPWLTVTNKDLPQIPKVGNIVDVQLPRVIRFKAS